jgi:AcrR family transcriptional regulator
MKPKASKQRVRLSPDARRTQILTAATAQIAARGYRAFTLSQLAKDCGLTRAGIEHHFASREDLLIGVLRHRDNLDGLAVQPSSLTKVSRETARAILDRLVVRNASQREIVRLYTVLQAESLDPLHPAHVYFNERAILARRDISRLAVDWHPRPERLAAEILAVMDGIQLAWLRDSSMNLEELWAGVADGLFRI